MTSVPHAGKGRRDRLLVLLLCLHVNLSKNSFFFGLRPLFFGRKRMQKYYLLKLLPNFGNEKIPKKTNFSGLLIYVKIVMSDE